MSMKYKRCTTFIFLLFTVVQYAYCQQSALPRESYLRFDAAGIPGSQIKETLQGKLTQVLTSGGFVGIHTTSIFDKLSNKLYYHAYYSEQKATKDTFFKITGAYLYPNKEFFIDILDKRTEALEHRYIIKRPLLIPLIKLHYQKNNSELPFEKLTLSDHKKELTVSPGEPVEVNIASAADFKNLEVEYTLVNLKTKRSKHEISKTSFEPLKLAANTEYELRFNYVVQKESVQIVYIRVKPYWYQSFITYIVLIIVFTAISFLLMSLFFKNKLKSSEKKQQKMEEAAIRLQAQLNPHFTFNALSSIQGLMNTDRIEEANHYLEEFSSLLRKTLAKSQHVFNSLDQELEMMRIYVSLEALRFGFSWDIEVSVGLNTADIEIPTLLLQPLIENSIRHGISGLGNKGQLLIICKKEEEKDTFIIVIKDNGAWQNKNSDSGYGLSLTVERIRAINKLKKGEEIVLNINVESGTEMILTFYNWINK